MRSENLYSAAGIAAPIVFLTAVITLGALEPGYSHLTKMMSVLGGVPGARGVLFNVAAIVSGVCVVLFAVGLHRGSRGGATRPADGSGASTASGPSAAMILLIVGGLGLGMSGVFACNEGCANVIAQPNAAGKIHMMAALMAGLGMGISPLFFFGRLRRTDAWRRYAVFTLITGIAANVPGIFFWVTMATTRLPAVEGLIQRLGIVFVLIWIEVIAWAMVRRTARGAVVSGPGVYGGTR